MVSKIVNIIKLLDNRWRLISWKSRKLNYRDIFKLIIGLVMSETKVLFNCNIWWSIKVWIGIKLYNPLNLRKMMAVKKHSLKLIYVYWKKLNKIIKSIKYILGELTEFVTQKFLIKLNWAKTPCRILLFLITRNKGNY